MSAREHSPVFRESFLAYQFDGERYETMRRFGEILDEMACEANALAPSFPRPILYPELEAVAVDLAAVVEDLEVASRDADSEVAAQVKLAGAALQWAEQLGGVVSEIRRAVNAEPENFGPVSDAQLLEDLRALRQRAGQLQMLRTPGSIAHRIARALDSFLRSEDHEGES
jgi:hypothetical protein